MSLVNFKLVVPSIIEAAFEDFKNGPIGVSDQLNGNVYELALEVVESLSNDDWEELYVHFNVERYGLGNNRVHGFDLASAICKKYDVDSLDFMDDLCDFLCNID